MEPGGPPMSVLDPFFEPLGRPARILVAHEEEIYGRGLRALLADHGLAENSPQVTCLDELMQWPDPTFPELLVLSLHFPPWDGLEAAARIRLWAPDTRVLLISSCPDATILASALRVGVQGLVRRHSPPGEILRAIRKVAGGRGYFSPVFRRSLQEAGPPPPGGRGWQHLLPADRELLTLFAQGASDDEVAGRTCLSPAVMLATRMTLMSWLGLAGWGELRLLLGLAPAPPAEGDAAPRTHFRVSPPA